MTTEEKFAAIKDGLDRLHAAMWDRHYGEGLAAVYAQAADVDYKNATVALAELRQEMAETVKSHQKMNANYEQSADENDELRALIAEAKLVSENDPNSDFGIAAVKAEALAEYTKVCKKRNEELGEIRRLREALRQIQWGNDSINYAGTVYNLCPLCDQSEVRGHSPDCLVGAALDAPKAEPCKRCGGTRSVRVKNRLTFDTDSAAERELAYDNVPCPNCQPDRRLFTFDRFEADSPVSAGIASARAASVAEALAKVQGEYPGSTFRLRGEE